MDWILSKCRLESESGFANEIPFRDPGEWLASLAFRLKIIYRRMLHYPIKLTDPSDISLVRYRGAGHPHVSQRRQQKSNAQNQHFNI